MSIVSLKINNKKYEIECADGEEKTLQNAVLKLDDIINQSTELKKLSESKMFLMTSILLAEESINNNLNNTNYQKSFNYLDTQLIELERLIKEKC
jgi:cell division protein ZapA (FtsZ GTPase activity inhibitor)